MRRYGQERADIPGTGGELAVHLLKRFDFDDVIVEETDNGQDHYDPAARAVRLGTKNFQGKSLTAVAIAAHEVGHAIQYGRKEPLSQLRSKYLPIATQLKRAGVFIMIAMPFLGFLIKAPIAIVGLIGLSVVLQLLGALTYLIILPEEWDASFGKAMPILIDGEYVDDADLERVQRILRAAALTYFAGALADIVNIGRWLLILRR